MKMNLKPLMSALLIFFMLSLAGCDGALSVDDYQDHVVKTLEGQEDEDLPDLVYSINITLDSMYCAEEALCVLAGEMEYFRQVASQESAYFGIYHKRICKDVKAPQQLDQDNEALCQSLSLIHSELKTLEHSAKLSRDYLRRTSVDLKDREAIIAARQSIEGIVQQMKSNKAAIQDALKNMQQIAWLDEIGQRIEKEIFSN